MIEEYTYETLSNSFFTAQLINRNITLHSHYFWEFTYSITGELINKVNGEPIKTHALCEILLIKPGSTHEILCLEQSEKPKYHRDVYVTPEKMKKCCDLLSPDLYDELMSVPFIVLDAQKENLEALERTLKLFHQYNGHSQKDVQFLEQLHTTILFQLLGIYLKNSASSEKKYPEWIEKFFERLKDEKVLCQKIEDVIKPFNYSHSYICREFKKHVGKTMVQCVNEARVIYSTIFLIDPNVTVLEIAMRLNYSSQSAYINAFKSVYGVSPNHWRRKQLNLRP